MNRRFLLIGAGALAAAAGFAFQLLSSRRKIVPVEAESLTDYTPQTPADVCIIGSGPAGCSLAQRLLEQGLSVVMIESGVNITDAKAAEISTQLDRYSSSGELLYPVQTTRVRGIGGTSNIWTGRCPRYKPSDFTEGYAREIGAWPIDYAELKPYYAQAEQTLYVQADSFAGGHAPRDLALPDNERIDISALKELMSRTDVRVDTPPVSASPSRGGPVRSVNDQLPALLDNDRFTLLSNATAVRLEHDGARITHVRLKSLDGNAIDVSAGRFVVACGAIESTRLLLLSASPEHPAGLGNDHDLLGRYFMEHPFYRYAATIPNFAGLPDRQLGRTYQFVDGLHAEGLGGVILAFYGRMHERLTIALGIEMQPSASNRITLNDASPDAFGNAGANVHFDFSESDRRVIERGEQIVRDVFSQFQATEFEKLDYFHFSHHHMGGMRMGSSAEDGVVDANLKVFGTDNLYVASSSVFRTSGTANPTLTIAALALRLGDHLGQRATTGAEAERPGNA